jgi:hypothetical protein
MFTRNETSPPARESATCCFSRSWERRAVAGAGFGADPTLIGGHGTSPHARLSNDLPSRIAVNESRRLYPACDRYT